jgi:capsular polysaccharide transport system permease protein
MPLLIVFAYIFFIAEDRFVSRSVFTIKSENESMASLDLGLLGGNSNSKKDQLIIENHIISVDMMNKVIKEFGVQDALAVNPNDPLWNFQNKPDSVEKFKRFQKVVKVKYDENAGISSLEVQNFNAKKSQEINIFIVNEAIKFVNTFSRQLNDTYVNHAEKELKISQERLSKALDDLNSFQENENILNPENENELILKNVSSLELQLSEEKLKYNELTGHLQEESPQVKAVKRRIQNLETQISEFKSKLVDKNDESLNDKYRIYVELKGNADFATEAYKASLKTLEASRMKAMTSQKYLMKISEPSLPDAAEYPRHILDFITIFGLIVLFNILIKIVITIFREYT